MGRFSTPIFKTSPGRPRHGVRNRAQGAGPRVAAAIFTSCLWFGVVCVPSAGVSAQKDALFGEDKALHYGISLGMAGASYGILAGLATPRPVRFGGAVVLAFAVGVVKEVYDAAGYGQPSGLDLLWDGLGALTGAGLAWLVDWLLWGPADEAPARRSALTEVASWAHAR